MTTWSLIVVGVVVILHSTSDSNAQIIFSNVQSTIASPNRNGPCTSANGAQGTCGIIQSCPFLLQKYRNRDIPFLRNSVCGERERIKLLCCPSTSAVTPAPVTPGPVTPAPVTPGPVTPGPVRSFRSPSNCGQSSFNPGRIVGGEPVQSMTEFPWMAALKYDTRENSIKCGAAIITDKWLLTAGHCIIDSGPVSAILGDLRLNTVLDDSFQFPPQKIKVEKTVRHESYRRRFLIPKGIANDIALIKLESSIKFSDYVKPICVPDKTRRIAELELKKSYIAGWGATEYDGVGSADMQWATVNTSEHGFCRRNYDEAGVHVHETLHICASGNDRDLSRPGCDPGSTELRCQGGVDSCAGDSGGPLMMSRSRFNRVRWFTEGVVSFAVGCGNARYPGIYTKVDEYLDWIGQNID